MAEKKFIPYSLPEVGEEEIDAVVKTLRSNWLTTGPRAQEFERAFGDYLGLAGDHGTQPLAVNSATAGLHLALEALGIGPGDEVIVPTLTFTATAEVVRYLGADPVFVDVDPDTLNIDLAAVRSAITLRTKAVMPVHYGGLACDMEGIFALVREHPGLRVVEDAAHALPTTSAGRLVGTLASDATVFSFYANKTIATGEGGMVVTRDSDMAKRMRIMRLHGMNRETFDRFISKKPAWYYEIVAPGFKYNLTDIAAAIGIEQLRKLPRFLKRRQMIAARYFDELRGLPLILPADAPAGETHAWHLFVVRVADTSRVDRDEVIQRLSDAGIGTSVHYVPLHRHPYWRDRYRLEPEMFPNADAAYRRMISIPLYTAMSDEDQTRVIEALRDVLS